MRYLLTSSVTLFLAAPVFAEDTALAQAMRPAVEAVTSYTQKSVLQSWSAGTGPMAEGAKHTLAQMEH